MLNSRQYFYYRVEAYIGDSWKPVSGHTYGCPEGAFKWLFKLLTLAPSQRIRRIPIKAVDLIDFYYNPEKDCLEPPSLGSY